MTTLNTVNSDQINSWALWGASYSTLFVAALGSIRSPLNPNEWSKLPIIDSAFTYLTDLGYKQYLAPTVKEKFGEGVATFANYVTEIPKVASGYTAWAELFGKSNTLAKVTGPAVGLAMGIETIKNLDPKHTTASNELDDRTKFIVASVVKEVVKLWLPGFFEPLARGAAYGIYKNLKSVDIKDIITNHNFDSILKTFDPKLFAKEFFYGSANCVMDKVSDYLTSPLHVKGWDFVNTRISNLGSSVVEWIEDVILRENKYINDTVENLWYKLSHNQTINNILGGNMEDLSFETVVIDGKTFKKFADGSLVEVITSGNETITVQDLPAEEIASVKDADAVELVLVTPVVTEELAA